MLKGNLVVGQSGGPTQVINNSLVGVIEEAMQHSQISGIYGMARGIYGLLNNSLLDLRKESAETRFLLKRTPSAALGTVRYKVQADEYEQIVNQLRKHEIRFFLYIGGNDSMDTAHKVHLAAQKMGYELCSIGIPKTVDNDLAYTDHCPGYGSAARFVALATRDTGRDTESMGPSSPVKIIEIMGRNAGWLTAASALARQEPGDAPHLIYLPERPVEEKEVIAAVEKSVQLYEYCVIALSEGAVSQATSQEVDAFGHKMKGGAAESLAALIKEHLGLKVRIDKPNYLQRSFSTTMSQIDADEAYRAGRAAVQLAMTGQSDRMITLDRIENTPYRCETGNAPLAKIANAEKLVPTAFIHPNGHDMTQSFVEYAQPLIGEALPLLGRLARYPLV